MNAVNELLESIKADLLSRRLLPMLVALSVALVAAIVYAATGATSTSTPAPSQASSQAPAPSPSSAVPLSAAPPNPNEAVAETPSGARFQSKAPERNPFLPLVSAGAGKTGPAGASEKGASSSSSSSGGAKSGGTGAGSNTGGSAPTQPSQPIKPIPPAKPPSKPAPPKSVYSVSILFGLAPASPGAQPTLTPFENLERLQPLPSASGALLVFMGVIAGGKDAVFALNVPPILRGPGTCLPSVTQCQALELAVGQTEELEYLDPSGQVFTFELQLVSIVKKSTPSPAADAIYRRSSKAGHEALESANLSVLDDLRFSSSKGVLVYTPPRRR